jgi:glutamate-1-semialdehyde aminotransferase
MYSLDELMNAEGPSLYKFAKNLIPGGTQLLSKRPEMFAPEIWPSYYSKAKGCKVWDLDGREFIDMSIMGVGACILGYADDEVDDAVITAIRKGVSSTLNAPEEVELAEALLELHPWFDMIRYARSGGEAMSIAVRIARSHTNREKVLFSGYHGWNDWYLAANLSDDKNLDGHLIPGLEPKGVPRSLINSSIPFDANSIESLRLKIKNQEKQIAAIIIEPARGEAAPKDYLQSLRALATDIGAVLIFDEITSGYRMCAGGIHRIYNVYPDIAVFAKSMANGYAMSAIIGVRKVMESAQKTFISSTNWTERIGPTAALATLKKYQRENVSEHLVSLGNKFKNIWVETAKKNDIKIKITGLPTLATIELDVLESSKLNTLITLEMLKKGFLAYRQFKPSFAHNEKILQQYKTALEVSLKLIKSDTKYLTLTTPTQHSGFHRLTKE